MAIEGQNRKITAAVIVAAGGTGTRMQSSVPKQFLDISGKPVLLHTVESIASLEEVTRIVIALPPDHLAEAEAMLRQVRARMDILCVAGGPNRQESVRCGVAHVNADPDVIMVHDAVRPACDRGLGTGFFAKGHHASNRAVDGNA